jgi:hypothetical protein
MPDDDDLGLSYDDPRLHDWGQYRRLILSELKRINTSIGEINAKIERFRQEDLNQIKTDIALLKFQALLYGAAASAVVSLLIAVFTAYIRTKV